MLKQRLLTAAVLISFLLWVILQLPTQYLALVFAVFILQGSWEWSGLMKVGSITSRGLYVILVASCMVVAWLYVNIESKAWLALPVISLFWWLTAIIWILTYPVSVSRWAAVWRQSVAGLFVLVPTWVAITGLHAYGEYGPYLVVYVMTLIGAADTGAYFGGRRWGRRKLAPLLSPGKTWEGVFSATTAGGICALITAYLFNIPGNQWYIFVVLSLVTVAFSVVGDLSESMFKRHAGVKDSGKVLPGHGGVLDRMDSLTAAAPVFAVGIWLTDVNFGGGNFS